MRAAIMSVLVACSGGTGGDTTDLHVITNQCFPFTMGEAACCPFPDVQDGPACADATNPDAVMVFVECGMTIVVDGVRGCCAALPNDIPRFFECE